MKTLILLAFLGVACSRTPDYEKVPRQAARAWWSEYVGVAFVKLSADSRYPFLLAYLEHTELWRPKLQAPSDDLLADTVYGYDLRTRMLEPLPKETWVNSESDSFCAWDNYFIEELEETGKWTFSWESDRKVRVRDKVVESAGKTVLEMATSPKGGFVAVLSAPGTYRAPLLPTGSYSVSGPRIHETFDRRSGQRIGSPIVLQDATDRNLTVKPFWSPDEKFVIYQDSYRHFWVIEVKKEAGK